MTTLPPPPVHDRRAEYVVLMERAIRLEKTAAAETDPWIQSAFLRAAVKARRRAAALCEEKPA